MKRSIQLTAVTLAGVFGLLFVAPAPAEAGSKGKRNTAIVLGAAGIYGIAKKKPLIAGLGLGSAAYVYSQSRRDADRERRRRHVRVRHKHVHVYRSGRRVCRH